MTAPRVTWDGEYLRQAGEDETRLASLHPRLRRYRASVPDECATRRTWYAAGPLIPEFGLEIRYDADEGTVTVCRSGERRGITESAIDHPDLGAATRAAIVRAAIQICVETRDAG